MEPDTALNEPPRRPPRKGVGNHTGRTGPGVPPSHREGLRWKRRADAPEGTLQAQAGARAGTPPLPLAPRFAKYYKTENGSEYRTLLKAFGIRFDVLVYGNVSPCAGRTGGQGRNPRPVPGPEEALSWSHLPAPHLAPHLCCEGAGPAAPLSVWLGVQVQSLATWPAGPPPTRFGLRSYRLASSTSSPPSSAPWQPSPPWEW